MEPQTHDVSADGQVEREKRGCIIGGLLLWLMGVACLAIGAAAADEGAPLKTHWPYVLGVGTGVLAYLARRALRRIRAARVLVDAEGLSLARGNRCWCIPWAQVSVVAVMPQGSLRCGSLSVYGHLEHDSGVPMLREHVVDDQRLAETLPLWRERLRDLPEPVADEPPHEQHWPRAWMVAPCVLAVAAAAIGASGLTLGLLGWEPVAGLLNDFGARFMYVCFSQIIGSLVLASFLAGYWRVGSAGLAPARATRPYSWSEFRLAVMAPMPSEHCPPLGVPKRCVPAERGIVAVAMRRWKPERLLRAAQAHIASSAGSRRPLRATGPGSRRAAAMLSVLAVLGLAALVGLPIAVKFLGRQLWLYVCGVAAEAVLCVAALGCFTWQWRALKALGDEANGGSGQ